MKVNVGDEAPDFTAPVAGEGYGEDGSVALSDLRGSRVVLVFYPKDRTPGCTTQACALRDAWKDLPSDVRIFGVSVDDLKSHLKFIEKESLPYPLISDPERKIVESYGVWVEKSMYGKKFMGTQRSTFVIDPAGKIESVLEKVSPKKHLELLKELL
ncbi:peroxiredoxin [Haloferula sp.]|uniref:peroxiredoxin n=1 Tax=Haloferula sp. TaxID=2497595 RepID=UPI00329C5739